jgi:hypothetical protein
VDCLNCGYKLDGLNAGACPECAFPFDPGDPRTYTSGPWPQRARRWWRIALVAGSGWLLGMVLLINGLLVVARVVLGRWPARYGADDPKGIPIVGVLHDGILLLGLLFPVAVIASLGALVTAPHPVLGPRPWRRAAIAIAGSAGLWTAGYVLARLDPAHAGVWFMD